MYKTSIPFIFLVFLFSCGERANESNTFEDNINNTSKKVLSFDLTDDDHLKAALFIRGSVNIDRHILPFNITNITNDKNYLSSGTSYGNFSVLYIGNQISTDAPICKIFFTPGITFSDEQTEDFFNSTYSDKGIYFKKSSSGLDRQFIYDFSYPHKVFNFLKLSDSLNLIRLHIPDKSTIHESNGILPIVDSNNVSKYTRSYVGSNTTGIINLSYTLPLSQKQQQVAKKGLELAKTVVPFLVSLFIALAIKDKKIKKGISIPLAVLSIGIVCFLIFGLFVHNNFISNFLLTGETLDYFILGLWAITTIVFTIFGIKQ